MKKDLSQSQSFAKLVENSSIEILILADERVGTYSQAIALAENLGYSYQILRLEYGFLAKLPNFLLSESLLRLTKSSRQAISFLAKIPKIIISSGRKSAPIALNLKRRSGNLSKIVQIMRPEINLLRFDFVVLPSHDLHRNHESANIIATIGAMNLVNPDKIESERQKFFKDFPNEFVKNFKILKSSKKTVEDAELARASEKPIIAVILGGGSNRTKFGVESARNLALQAIGVAKITSASLLFLTSRRTGADLVSEIKSELIKLPADSYRLLDWNDIKDQNPYFAVLGLADCFIVSGDSVSMISECCSTGKPVYIFDEKEISTPKHRKFHQAIIDGGYGRRLSDQDLCENLKLKNYCAPKLNEAKRVAEIIRESL